MTPSEPGTKPYLIFRRYSDFYDLEQQLKKRFPIDSGARSSGDRVLPNLPQKRYIGRSAIHDVAQQRMPDLQTYLQALIKAPPKISACDLVRTFFTRSAEDATQEQISIQQQQQQPQTPKCVPPTPGAPCAGGAAHGRARGAPARTASRQTATPRRRYACAVVRAVRIVR